MQNVDRSCLKKGAGSVIASSRKESGMIGAEVDGGLLLAISNPTASLGINMDLVELHSELISIIEEYGGYPYEFFNILHNSENVNLDLKKQNELWSSLKIETWHNLNLERYVLWSISDNGDLLWWNGVQVLAINPRAFEFMSLPVAPKQFIQLIGLGKVTGIFPSELWQQNA